MTKSVSAPFQAPEAKMQNDEHILPEGPLAPPGRRYLSNNLKKG